MTTAEIKSLYNKIFELLYLHRWKEAFSHLGYLIQQNGFGQNYDDMSQQETNYRYLLRYNLENEDKTRDEVQLEISGNIAEIADKAYRQWMSSYANQWYYAQLRYQRTSSLSALTVSLESLAEEINLYAESRDRESVESKMKALRLQREQLAGDVFMTILLSSLWTEEDFSLAVDLFSHVLEEHEQALMVSALLLALQHLFDEQKIIFLSMLCQQSSEEVSRRALTVLMLMVYHYDKRLPWYPKLKANLSVVFDDPARRSAMLTIFIQLIRAKDVEQINKRMQEEFLPEMNKLGSSIQQKMEGQEQDDLTSDWKELFEDSAMSEKLQEFSALQTEGVDVYMSTFSALKFYPFFKDIYNWFQPFYKSHSVLSELFGHGDKAGGIDLTDLVTKSDFLCSSDKYSFCFNLAQVPEVYRNQMAGNFGADTEAFQEMQKMEQSGKQRLRVEWISNRYIQDLYRFYKLFPNKRDFEDVFVEELDFYGVGMISDCFEDDEKMKLVAAAYFKNKHYTAALKLYRRLTERHPGEYDLLRKVAYCLQQLADYEVALAEYLKADLIQSDNLWTLKRIAVCYRQLKQYDKALVYYRRAADLDPENLSLCLNIGHCLLNMKQYQEAMNYYYKAEFLSPDSPKIWRPLAWCALSCGKYEQADKYFRKILQQQPEMPDYLNAGHLEWLKGSRLKAVEVYKKGIRLTHTAQNDFFELFEKDLPDLMALGIKPSEISVVRDGLMYLLEE